MFSEYIENHTTNVIVQNLPEFLEHFEYTSINNQNIIELIENKIKEKSSSLIGTASAFGKTIKVLDGPLRNVAIKVIDICPDVELNTTFQRNICEIAKNGSYVFHIPNSVNLKHTLLAPNVLSELLVCIIMGQGPIQAYCPNFMKIYGVEYKYDDPSKPMAYIVMELLQPLKDNIKSTSDAYWHVFQSAWGLSQAQKLHRYVHFDLHGENFMARSRDNNVMAIYELPNGKFLHYRPSFDTIIIDYGMSRLETDAHVIIPRTTQGSQTNIRPDLYDFYAFNPYIDMFTTIFHSICMLPIEYVKLSKLHPKQLDIYSPLCKKFLRMFFKMAEDEDPYDWIYKNKILFGKSWRPNIEKLITFDSPHLPPSTPDEMYMHIINEFEQTQIKHGLKPAQLNNRKNLDEIARYMLLSPVITDRRLIELVGTDYIESYVEYNQIPINQQMITETLPIYTVPNTKLNDDISISTNDNQLTIKTILNGKSVGHYAFINQSLLYKENYRWHFDCCRVNIQDILREPNVVSGISMNASFFKLTDNFEPVGIYVANNVIINNPSDDELYYGTVYVDNDGMIKVDRLVNNMFQYEQILTSGPILVWDGKIDDEEMCKTYNIVDGKKVYTFNCRQPMNKNNEVNQVIFDDGLTNCNKIKPGTLKHGCQKNPRTALFIKKNGDVGMIYFEGRDSRGPGLTLTELAKICVKLGADRAINLDGGNSSQLLWKKEEEKHINQLNPLHNYVYPVGTTISFLKKS